MGRKRLRVPSWVGVTRIAENDVVPDGLAYAIYPEVISIRFQFLRLIGFKVNIGLVPCIPSTLLLLRRARVVYEFYLEPQAGWGWKKVLEIKFKGASA